MSFHPLMVYDPAKFQQSERHVVEEGPAFELTPEQLKYAASDVKYRHLSANNLVFWRAMEWYLQHGHPAIQLGRTSLDNEGLRRFKRSWGAREYPINYYRYSAKEQDFVAGTDLSSGWQTRIFRALPSQLSRTIGTLAYKHIG